MFVPGSPLLAGLAAAFVFLYISSCLDWSRFSSVGSGLNWRSCFRSSGSISLDEQYIRKNDLEQYLSEYDSAHEKGWNGHIMLDPKPLDERYFTKRDRDVTVGVITVTGHAQSQEQDGKPLLHWRVGAAFGDDPEHNVGRSVQYDTAKPEGDTDEPVIQVDIRSTPKFAFSSRSAVHIFLHVKEGVSFTPNDIAEVIKGEHGLPVFWKYKYDGNGSGCLFWSKQLISKLETLEWIEAGSLAKVESEIKEARESDKWWIPDDKGEFFDQE